MKMYINQKEQNLIKRVNSDNWKLMVSDLFTNCEFFKFNVKTIDDFTTQKGN